MSLYSTDEDVGALQNKSFFLNLIVVFIFFITLLRLFYLQILQGGSYRRLSEQMIVREEELRADRGNILDRKGKVLANNRYYYDIVAIPQYLKDKNKSLESLASLIPVNKEDFEAKLKAAQRLPSFLPVVLVEDASYEWAARVKEYFRPEYEEGVPINLEGIQVRVTLLRNYLYPELFSHALGYLKEVDKKTLSFLQGNHPDRYSLGDYVGASGLEREYDLQLRGYDGVRARVVDARGHQIRGVPDVSLLEERANVGPIAGKDLLTTLDYKAQQAAAQSFNGRRGGVVAFDPNNGEVFVLYSSPGYNANRIIKNIDKDYWRMINIDQDKYLFNRAIQATYPPGSTYKIITSISGLEDHQIDHLTPFRCGGGLQFGSRFFKCWKSGGHGTVQLIRAIMQSCDVFFYQVGLKVGVDGLYHYAHLFGLGEKTGIDLPYEQPGLIPSSEWKLKRFRQPWIQSETLSIAIGQGYDLLTPLQNAKVIAMVANGGRPIKPHLAKAFIDNEDMSIQAIDYPLLGTPVVDEKNLKLVQEGLIQVVHGQGTAGRLRASPHKIAGKTGTAQVIGDESKVVRSDRTKDHALFVAYAPYDQPQIAVSVVVENGGHGGAAAAPVAQAVIDAYLGE